MKKIICSVLMLCWFIPFSVAQNKPLEIYSAYRYYNSDKTKTGTGFKYRHFINVKPEYLFSVYSDRIIYNGKNIVVYKIYQTKRYSDDTRYLVNDSNGQYFNIAIEDIVIDKKHYYGIEVIKTDKSGLWLSDTRFDVNKVK